MEPVASVRSRFHDELAAVDAKLSELVQSVSREVSDATEALLKDDLEASIEISSRRHLSDPLYEQVAHHVEVLIARQAPMASDLRYLLAVVRVVPELEQSASLADEIGRRGGLGIAHALTPRGRALVTRSGDLVTAMWDELRRAWDKRTPAAESLEAAQEELRDLHTSLTAEVASCGLSASVTMDMALIGRFYERLGDHAVNIADRFEGLNAWSLSAQDTVDRAPARPAGPGPSGGASGGGASGGGASGGGASGGGASGGGFSGGFSGGGGADPGAAPGPGAD